MNTNSITKTFIRFIVFTICIYQGEQLSFAETPVIIKLDDERIYNEKISNDFLNELQKISNDFEEIKGNTTIKELIKEDNTKTDNTFKEKSPAENQNLNTFETLFLKSLLKFNYKDYSEAYFGFINSSSSYKSETENIKHFSLQIKKENREFIKKILSFSNTHKAAISINKLPDLIKRFIVTKEFIKLFYIQKEIDRLENLIIIREKKEINLNSHLNKIERIKAEIKKSIFKEFSKKVSKEGTNSSETPWIIDYYISKSIYMSSLQNINNTDIRQEAIKVNENFLKRYASLPNDIAKEIIYRLKKLYYNKDGFSNDIINIYNKLTDKRFTVDIDTSHAMYELGIEFYNSGFVTKSKEVLIKLKRKFPRSIYIPEILFRLGEMEFYDGEIDSAYEYYVKASLFKSSYYSFVSLYRKGWINYKFFEHEEALTTFNKLYKNIYNFKKGNLTLSNQNEQSGFLAIIDSLEKESEKFITSSLYELGGINRFFNFLSKNIKKIPTTKTLNSFSNIYHLQKDYLNEITIVNTYILTYPFEKNTLDIYSALIKKFERKNLFKYANKLREDFIIFYSSLKDRRLIRQYKVTSMNAYIQSGRYYHLTGKKTGNKKLYEKSKKIYTEFFIKFINEPIDPDVYFNFAELFFDNGEYIKSAKQYTEVLKYRHENKDIKEKAILSAILAYNKYMVDEKYPSALEVRKFYNLAINFIKTYPDNKASNKVSVLISRRLLAEKQYKKTVSLLKKFLNKEAEKEIKVNALNILGQSYYHLKKYNKSIEAFAHLINYTKSYLLPEVSNTKDVLFKVGENYYTKDKYLLFKKDLENIFSKKIEKNTYNQLWHTINNHNLLEDLYALSENHFEAVVSPLSKKDKKILSVARNYLRLSNIKIAENAFLENNFKGAAKFSLLNTIYSSTNKSRLYYLYNASKAYIKMSDIDKAEKILNFISNKYLSSLEKELKLPVLTTFSHVLESKGKILEAAGVLEKASYLPNIKKAKRFNIILKTASLYDLSSDSENAILIYQRFIKLSKVSDKKYMEAALKVGEAYEQTGNNKGAAVYFNKVINGFKHFKKNKKAKLIAAKAYFKLSERDYSDYININLKESDLKKAIKAKQTLLKQVVTNYNHVIQLGVFEFSSASFFMLGKVYEDFKNLITNYSIPEYIKGESRKKYLKLLSKKADPFLKKAINSYRQNIEFSSKNRFNKWVRKSLISLSKIDKKFSYKEEEFSKFNNLKPIYSSINLNVNGGFKISDFKQLNDGYITEKK